MDQQDRPTGGPAGVGQHNAATSPLDPPAAGPGASDMPPRRACWADMLDTMEAPGHSRQLLLQLNSQRTKGFLCDVIIVVQNTLFRAHKNMLAASSAYFNSLVVHDNLLNLDHDMVSPAVFRLVLDFIYTGCLANGAAGAGAEAGAAGSEAAGAEAPGAEPSLGALLAAASYLQIPDLVALCKKRLKRHGKYCHLRGGHGGSYAPYGRPGRGLPAATSVIQACFSSPAGLPPPGPEAVVSMHCAELYASGSGPAASLCSPEGRCSPVCILDLSKKSPPGSSVPEQPLSTRELPGSLDGLGANGKDYKSSSEDPSPPVGHLEGIPCGKGFPSSEQLAHVKEEEALYGRVEAAEVSAGAPGGLGELLRPYRCASCDKSYKNWASLWKHEKTHSLTPPYLCTICGKRFSQRWIMTRHMRSHLGLKPFACKTCGKRFTRHYSLTEHMRSHLGLKPFACNTCGKRFTRQYCLTEHMCIHSGGKPWECQVCGGKFVHRNNLISHMKKHAIGGAAGALAGLGALPRVPGPDGKGKLASSP